MTKSEFGRRFLTANSERYSLEISYDDNNTPCLNLYRLEEYKSNTSKTSFNIVGAIPLDMTNIYEQIADYFNSKAS